MPDFAEILNLILTSGSLFCGAIVVLGVVGFIWALVRGKPFFSSLRFGILVVMASLLLPAAFGVGTYIAYNSTAAFMRNALEAQGVVVRLEERPMQDSGIGFSAIVEFSSASGSKVEFEDNGAVCDPPCHQVGQQVTVLYDPENPANAAISNPLLNWIWVLVLGFLTLVFLLLALWFIWNSYQKDRYWGVLDILVEAAAP